MRAGNNQRPAFFLFDKKTLDTCEKLWYNRCIKKFKGEKMNQIAELVKLPKGTEVEFEGEITFENPPRANLYGSGFSQFVVVKKGADGIGCNIPIPAIENGYHKKQTVNVKGKINKYPDKKQPLTENGTYPIKTSVNATSVEEIVIQDDNALLTDADIEKINEKSTVKPSEKSSAKPNTNKYNSDKEEEKKMWAAKDLKVCKQAMIKTIGRWVEVNVIPKSQFFKWVTRCVDFVYNEDDAFDLIVEAQMMKSGLIECDKKSVTAWIDEHMKGTACTLEMLGVKKLDIQTLVELLDTAERLSLVLGEEEGI